MSMAEHPKIDRYLHLAALVTEGVSAAEVSVALRDLLDAMGELPDEFDEASLYRYVVPKLSEDGACSLIEEMDPTPYDLTRLLGAPTAATTRKLRLLNQVVDRAAGVTGADWLGIYQRRDRPGQPPALVKLAYRGRPSRAEFPLTADFAKGSTNSTVGLSGKASVIRDVAAHTAQGGGFYVCDVAVQSEACLPILTDTGEVIGILDAEAAPVGFFSAPRLAVLVAASLLAGGLFP